jgi:N-acetylglucosamine-6-phosphate deacetylase
MMSAVPARLLGLNSRGKIEKGFDAELILLDKSFKTVKVFSEVLK